MFLLGTMPLYVHGVTSRTEGVTTRIRDEQGSDKAPWPCRAKSPGICIDGKSRTQDESRA